MEEIRSPVSARNRPDVALGGEGRLATLTGKSLAAGIVAEVVRRAAGHTGRFVIEYGIVELGITRAVGLIPRQWDR